jgi:hypothetical protein
VNYRKKVILCISVLALFGPWGCAGLQSQMGAAPCDCFPPELLTEFRPWRGGLVGAPPGDTIRLSQGLISQRGSREAAEHNKPVEYRTEDGLGYYRAEPQGYDAQKKCVKVRETTYESNQLIKDEVREICDVTDG